MELKIESVMDEQASVKFTGKLNILSNFNRQFLGHILFLDGEVIHAKFNAQEGVKALYQLYVQEFSLNSFHYVVEPELISPAERKITIPYSNLKTMLKNVLSEYQSSLKQRPPENVKILIDAKFVESLDQVTKEEFEVLATLTEWSKPFDVYQHCGLLDHEITKALVSLRKKNALKILASQAHG